MKKPKNLHITKRYKFNVLWSLSSVVCTSRSAAPSQLWRTVIGMGPSLTQLTLLVPNNNLLAPTLSMALHHIMCCLIFYINIGCVELSRMNCFIARLLVRPEKSVYQNLRRIKRVSKAIIVIQKPYWSHASCRDINAHTVASSLSRCGLIALK